jgi:hypothetical protein
MVLLRPSETFDRQNLQITLGPDCKERTAYEEYAEWCVAHGHPVGSLESWLRTNRGIADNWYRLRER